MKVWLKLAQLHVSFKPMIGMIKPLHVMHFYTRIMFDMLQHSFELRAHCILLPVISSIAIVSQTAYSWQRLQERCQMRANYLVKHVPKADYSKTCVKRPLSKRQKIGFQDQLSLNAGKKYCRMLQGEHSAIVSTFIKLPFVIKIFVLSIFDWPFYTGFTV